MVKRITTIVIVFNIIFLYMNIVLANTNENEQYLSEGEFLEVTAQTIEEPVLNSRIAVAYDRKTGNVIWGKNEYKKSAMASTTKIMTALLAIENCDLNEVIEVSSKAAGIGGSRLGLKKDDKINMNDLLYGLMLKSGNDAAVSIAETVGGSVEGFAELMNKKAKEIGLENTHFVTPHGLDDPEHYTTAYELAKLADYALKNDKFAKIVNTKNYTVTINGYPKAISNTNELLGYLDGVNGVKTGFTNNAGRCLVTSVDRNNFEIITVVLQADTKKFRTSDSIKIIEYVYNNYQYVNIKEMVDEKFNNWCLINKNRIIINKSQSDNLELYISKLENDIIPLKKDEIDNINIEINSLYYFDAPVAKDTVFGNLKVMLGDEVIDIVEIKNSNIINKKNVWDYFEIFAFEIFSPSAFCLPVNVKSLSTDALFVFRFSKFLTVKDLNA